MSKRTLRGKVAIVGIGETTYYRRGKAPDPEFKLAIEAMLKACQDAGINPHDIDGFSSYSNDRNDPPRLVRGARLQELASPHAVGWRRRRRLGCRSPTRPPPSRAATLIASWSIRALAQGQFGALRRRAAVKTVSGAAAYTVPYRSDVAGTGCSP